MPAGEILTVTGPLDMTAGEGATTGLWMKFGGMGWRVIEIPLGMVNNGGVGFVWIIVGGLAGGIIGNVLLAATCGGAKVGVEMRRFLSVNTCKEI